MKKSENAKTIKSGKPHGNSRLAKIGVPELARKRKPGALRGNANALKTGLHTAQVKDQRRRLRAWRHKVRDTLERVEKELEGPKPQRSHRPSREGWKRNGAARWRPRSTLEKEKKTQADARPVA